ncbi:MAG: ribose-phosphate pyrophosphokinase [candidate division WOR-3 bacterium]|nr:ribose-phosphate pyrophosphokinase [candidate division WOR-3 bacterium]MCX7837287.1 ribose-phosphate pyrophosphokinase [candidate division WOR-3 bacterium]MDW8113950.1 ribose-phosphate pyrophosphokinase [candidate division WOR-3 bacterium]
MKESCLKIFTGRANPQLAQKICEILNLPLGKITIYNFADGEIYLRIEESVRGCDVFLIQPTNPPAENVLECFLFLDALKRASAGRITAVIPYFGYARQDRKDEPRVAISAKLIADLLQKSGADRILTVELHAEQIQGFFDIPVDHIYSAPIFIEYFKKEKEEILKEAIVVSPDIGGARRAMGFAKRLGELPIAIIDKRRIGPNQAEVYHLIGEVKNKVCIIFDDLIDTAGTIVKASEILKEKGAKEIYVCACHPLFSKDSCDKILNSPIDEVFVSDTIFLPQEKLNNKIKQLTISKLLAEAIKRIHSNESVSSLFI